MYTDSIQNATPFLTHESANVSKPTSPFIDYICVFKQILSVSETDALLKDQLEDQEIEDFYKKFILEVDSGFTKVSESLHGDMDREELSDTILKLAVSSYAQKLACQQRFIGNKPFAFTHLLFAHYLTQLP